MRRGILLAGGLVLAADIFVFVKAAQNRSGQPTAAIELTERELRLVRPQRESTALFLELAWEPARGRFKFEDGPGWFDQAKLEALGYDCRLPLTDASAPAHYRAMPAKQAFAVLEYNEARWGNAGEDRSSWSRLVTIDAGLDFALLRGKYPDARRFLIVPCLVRLLLEPGILYAAKRDANTRRDAPGGYLRGAVVEMLVSQISVPSSERHVLEGLRQTTAEYFTTPEARARGPRYSAMLYYGRNHEPWVGAFKTGPGGE
jgi:hypothetical protein